MAARTRPVASPRTPRAPPDAHVVAELASELVVDEVPELVEEAERDPAVAPRDAHVDGIAVSKPVAAAWLVVEVARTGTGSRSEWTSVQRVRRCEGAVELRIERAASRQPQHVRERPQPRLPGPGDGGRLPPGLSAATAHRLNLRAKPDAADNGQMRVVARAPDPAAPLLRLAVLAPGGEREPTRARRERSRPARRRRQLPRFLDAARRDHPERRLGRLRRARPPVRRDEPVGLDLRQPRAHLARQAGLVRVSARRRLRSRRRWTRSAASSRSRTSRGTSAGSSTRRGRSATPCRRRRSSPGASASRLATRGRSPCALPRTILARPRRVPLRAVPARRRIRPAPRHGRVAERLEAQPRWTNTHGRPSPGSGELRRPATTKSPSSTSGRESGVLGAGGGPSREISSYRSSSCTKTRWLAGTTGAGSSGFGAGARAQLLDLLAQPTVQLLEPTQVALVSLLQLRELAFSALGHSMSSRSRSARSASSRSRASASSESSRPGSRRARRARAHVRSALPGRVLGSPRAPPVRARGSPRSRRARGLGSRRARTARGRARSALRLAISVSTTLRARARARPAPPVRARGPLRPRRARVRGARPTRPPSAFTALGQFSELAVHALSALRARDLGSRPAR